MRLSQYPVSTLKEVPADAEIVSHQLMLRAGMIRRLAAGLYTWLPMGLRTLRKVERVVREEMNRAGALELLMPTIQPPSYGRNPTAGTSTGPSCCVSKTATPANSPTAPRMRRSSPTSHGGSCAAISSCR